MVFSDLWAGRAVKTTLTPKFGGPAQKWGRVGLGKGGIGWNPRPPFPPLTPPPPPLRLRGREEEGGRKGREGVSGGKRGGLGGGCMGWVHAPPPPLAAPTNFF
jgi:hypothetical protein